MNYDLEYYLCFAVCLLVTAMAAIIANSQELPTEGEQGCQNSNEVDREEKDQEQEPPQIKAAQLGVFKGQIWAYKLDPERKIKIIAILDWQFHSIVCHHLQGKFDFTIAPYRLKSDYEKHTAEVERGANLKTAK